MNQAMFSVCINSFVHSECELRMWAYNIYFSQNAIRLYITGAIYSGKNLFRQIYIETNFLTFELDYWSIVNIL